MILVSPYQLIAAHALNARTSRRVREGFLLRLGEGYACVQPWPELGHPSCAEHLQALRRGIELPLLQQARRCAAIDAAARAQGISLWAQATVPTSHATITHLAEQCDAANAAGFNTWKLKTHCHDRSWFELATAHPQVRLRLDFNSSATPTELLDWWQTLPEPLRERLDFIEDPCPYDAALWRNLQQQHGLPLALDGALGDTAPADFFSVWKPAWQAKPRQLQPQRSIVTSAMDHPLGQAWAAWNAAATCPDALCGLRTDHLYAPNAFQESLGPWQPAWPQIAGTGLGFDELLPQLTWTRLS